MKLSKIFSLMFLVILISYSTAKAQNELPAWLDPNYGGFGGAPFWAIYYSPSLKELNDDLKNSLQLSEIKRLTMGGGTLRWTFYEYLQLGYIGSWFYGESSGFSDPDQKCKSAFLSGGFHALNAFYKVPKGKFNYAIGAGVGWYGVDYEKLIEPLWKEVREVSEDSEDKTNYTKSAFVSGDTIGYQIILEGSYKLARWIDIGTSISYLQAKIDNLKQAGKVVEGAPKIDLSGVIVSIGPRINF
ncbi:hypothetical protein KJ997_01445 [bacterium]|nr:hypothetical protein [bacterium]